MMTVAEFTLRTVMPAEDVAYLESAYAGFLAARLAANTSRIYARLRKRYAVPFAAPVPEAALDWLTKITTVEAYQKRGWNTSDEQSKDIAVAAATAFEEIKEAADAEEGLFDLPLRENTTTEGISKGGPQAYAEASPYDWVDAQREAIRGR